MALKLTVVIPSYNASSSLAHTLRSLRQHWGEISGSGADIIVVDDGSTDDTHEVIGTYRDLPLRDLILPRNARSGRARARNRGLDAAKGRMLLLLDSGVAVGPGLLASAAGIGGDTTALIYKTLGLFAPPGHRLTAATALRRDPSWRDVREGYFDGDGVPAPWLLAWTCALAVPRSRAVEVKGFDEGFLGWGVEDVDFAKRLSDVGVRFLWEADAVAVHTPQHRSVVRFAQHARNARRMHAKFFCRETEVFLMLCDGFATNLLISRLDRLQLSALCPPQPLPGHTAWFRPSPNSIYVGLRWDDAPDFAPAVALVHEPSLIPTLERQWPSTQVRCLLGVATPFETGQFECAVVGDLVRLLPTSLQLRLLEEMARISRRVVLLASTNAGYEACARQWAGWSWASLEDISKQLRASGMHICRTRRIGSWALGLEAQPTSAITQSQPNG